MCTFRLPFPTYFEKMILLITRITAENLMLGFASHCKANHTQLFQIHYVLSLRLFNATAQCAQSKGPKLSRASNTLEMRKTDSSHYTATVTM